MRNFYRHLPEMKKLILWMVVAEIAIAILSLFCIFIGYYGIPLGIILGAIIAIFNFYLIQIQSERLLRISKPSHRFSWCYLLRYFLYALGLTIALLCQKLGFPLFNVFAVFGAYLVPKIVLYIYYWKGERE